MRKKSLPSLDVNWFKPAKLYSPKGEWWLIEFSDNTRNWLPKDEAIAILNWLNKTSMHNDNGFIKVTPNFQSTLHKRNTKVNDPLGRAFHRLGSHIIPSGFVKSQNNRGIKLIGFST